MQIKLNCSDCSGLGKVYLGDPPQEFPCVHCNGVGYNTTDIIGNELTDILSKSEEIKTKINQMGADINQISAKVDKIWNKVK